MWDRTYILNRQISEKRALGISAGELNNMLLELADIAIQEKAYNTAMNCLIELGDKTRVAEVSALCLNARWLHDALDGYKFLGDNQGVYKVVFAAINMQDDIILETALESYLQTSTGVTINDWFKRWEQSRGYAAGVFFPNAPVSNMAYHLAPRYDLGVCVAKGGLFSASLFEAFGLETRISECHKYDNVQTTFEWIDHPRPQEMTGKRILVIDKDVSTGYTTARVLDEINEFSPGYVDLCLVHPRLGPCQIGIGSKAENIDAGYRRVHFPQDFNYQHFDVAIARLEERFGEIS